MQWEGAVEFRVTLLRHTTTPIDFSMPDVQDAFDWAGRLRVVNIRQHRGTCEPWDSWIRTSAARGGAAYKSSGPTKPVLDREQANPS